MKKIALVWISGALACAAASAAPARKIAPDLAAADPQSNVNVIVQWKKAPTNDQHQKVFSRGGTLISTLNSIKAGVYSISAASANDLAKDPDVAYVAPDRKVSANLDYSAAAINAPTAWKSGWTGAGISVAVIDSGINPTDPNFGGKRVVFTYDFTGKNGQDQYGHGQHVAGIIAANGQTSNCPTCTRTLKGIAPGVNLVNFRVLDQNGQGADSNVIAAIEAAILLKNKYNIRVINLSLGRPVYESYMLDPLCQAVEAAWQAGIVVVVAAGNDGRDNSFGSNGYGTITAPGNDPYVITVGAMKTEGTYDRSDDLIASYSSKGPTMYDQVVKPDIVAPGNLVVSLQAANSSLVQQNPGNRPPLSYYENVPGPANGPAALQPSAEYMTLSGTSMAAAVVSGAVADLLQAQPSLTPDQVKARLMKTAYNVFPQSSEATDPSTGQAFVDYYDPFTVGAGYLDLAAALADNSIASGSAMSPSATYDSTTGTLTFLFPASSVWNTSSVWTTSSVWPTSSVWGVSTLTGATSSVWSTSSVWNLSSVWNTSSVWNLSSVWSTSSVWGTSSVWSLSSVWGASATDTAQSSTVAVNGEQ